ncbi:MAG: hypothetical protein AAFY78_11285 [Cyanobacteria bacterium J06648_16]
MHSPTPHSLTAQAAQAAAMPVAVPLHSNKTPLRTRGILYCQKLMHQGIVYSDARSIASAIAKFDDYGRCPNHRQRRLIMQHSAKICRARLWRAQLLLERGRPSASQPSKR